ncbi:hypothetical protein JTB14_036289 [Gonioctena quinquepunctata]|nr:hypothetical protein JTB14_036289 [Gonioctena quinquepunctata]
MFPTPGYGINHPPNAPHFGVTSSTRRPPAQAIYSSHPPLSPPGTSNNKTRERPVGLIPQLSDDLNHFFSSIIPSALGANRRKLKNHHHLGEGQKKTLLKKLSLANHHGKKKFRFKELQPFGCYVVCNEIQQPFHGSTVDSGDLDPQVPQQGSQDEGEEDSEEDTYVEGEDKPIEATAEPPQSK